MDYPRQLLIAFLLPIIFFSTILIPQTFAGTHDNSITPERMDYRLVTSKNLWIIPVAMNSPYAGEASIEMSNTFWWEFGSLASQRKETSYTISVSLKDGASTALLEPWKVNVYDVYNCVYIRAFSWQCTYIGRMAAAVERLPGAYLWEYEHEGDTVDNTIPLVQTYICSSGNCYLAGENWFNATYKTMDDYVVVTPGTSCITRQITVSNVQEFTVNIGLTVGSIKINGLAHGGFGSTAINKVTYKFCGLPDKTVINLIDYLGPYDLSQNKYPLIWAFYSYTYSGTTAPNDTEIREYESNININSTKYVVAKVGVSKNNSLNWIITPEFNIINSPLNVQVKYKILKIGVDRNDTVLWTRPLIRDFTDIGEHR
ncbi:MAG: hypothetical protein GSR72_05045 [Desulfurococcales archaeon]|nr:hypothetical protein [Desulfurococcales archaeon]